MSVDEVHFQCMHPCEVKHINHLPVSDLNVPAIIVGVLLVLILGTCFVLLSSMILVCCGVIPVSFHSYRRNKVLDNEMVC